MTVKQLAKELNVSPQAVYQRLQKNKIDVKTLTHPVTKELTTDGEFVIRSMYNQDDSKALTEKQSSQVNQDKELEELRKQVKELIEKNSTLEKRVEEVIGEREAFREAMQTSQRMQEQMLNRFLPEPKPAEENKPQPVNPRKLTLRERFTGRIDSSSKG
jgi:Mn-dependent DtxR family transcriptional regulator